MTSLILRYAEDPATGLPCLEDPSGRLSSAELDALGRAVEEHFERLTSGADGQLLDLGGAVGPNLPRYFRVTLADRDRRCPTLLLEAVAPPEPGVRTAANAAAEEPLSAAPGRWQLAFLAEIAERLADTAASSSRSPLDFVLADLRTLLRKDPRKFTLLLFAGYLHIGDALSREHGEAGESKYAQAARELVRLTNGMLLEGALAPLLSPPAADTSAIP